MGELKPATSLQEFTLHQRPDDIVEQLLQLNPAIIGLGVYIWNCVETLEVVRTLKIVRPDIVLVIGGPEISYETTEQDLYKLADHVITGQADHTFAQTCKEILQGDTPVKLISSLPFQLNSLTSPYPEYTDEDLANRVLYVEASRGCPFKCEFCLSSLDKTATAFDIDEFLNHMRMLLQRGARHFKFVDRTFNLKTETSQKILLFFLDAIEQQNKELFLHFELIPDRLPESLKELLPRFPPGCLQFEIGIQSFNPEVQKLISRKQQHDKTCANLKWLRANTHAHIHADLIFGLPGESLRSFGQGFNELVALNPQEVQVGILKRLRGTPLARHTAQFDMRYQSSPPYRILSNQDNSFDQVQRMVRFARYWDLIANSGRFPHTLPLLLADDPFHRFMQSSDWFFAQTGQTHKIALPKLFTMVYQLLTEHLDCDQQSTETALLNDFVHNKLKGHPSFVSSDPDKLKSSPVAKRQRRHATS